MTNIDALRHAQAALPAIYRDATAYDLLAQMTAPADLPMYRALAAEFGGPVLDLACGTGRVALALAAEGYEVEGVDLSSRLLEQGGVKAAQLGLPVTFRQADLRAFDCQRTFRLLILSYNSLNHLHTLTDQRRFFDCARAHMAPDSRLVIDTFQPSLQFLGNHPEQRRPILRYLDPYLQQEVLLHEEHHYEPATQIDTVQWFYTIGAQAEAATDTLRMRLFFPQELDALIAAMGFVIERKSGDYDGAPFGSTSSKQIIVARMADA
ncbi:class I SAM-dependent methyltransferase [Viridibacterium curvum]|uniref:Class I SAM-dependent methyltransferase n=1 Tax=Viridibacterium curvum TaxID=1101404 RepID=A0ABP9QRM6_9RHOO